MLAQPNQHSGNRDSIETAPILDGQPTLCKGILVSTWFNQILKATNGASNAMIGKTGLGKHDYGYPGIG
jgi:hypothetical protein